MFAGTDDGNVCVWNLQDKQCGKTVDMPAGNISLHCPSFMTHCMDVLGDKVLTSVEGGHHAPICYIDVICNEQSQATKGVLANGELISDDRLRSNELLQIVSMDEDGMLMTWVVIIFYNL